MNLEGIASEITERFGVDFVDSGLLWAINRYVLHPQGLALQVDVGKQDRVGRREYGFSLIVSDDGEYQFEFGVDTLKRQHFEEFCATTREKTKNAYADTTHERLGQPDDCVDEDS